MPFLRLFKSYTALAFFSLSSIFCSTAFAQNMTTLLNLNEKKYFNGTAPKMKIELMTIYLRNEEKTRKTIQTFDAAGMLLKEERFEKNGVISERITYDNDTVNRLKLGRTFERWLANGTVTIDTIYFYYDKRGFLVGTIDKDKFGDITRYSKVICNEKGDPVEIALFAGNGNPYGKETAEYFYDRNTVVTTVTGPHRNIISMDSFTIRKSKDTTTKEDSGSVDWSITTSSGKKHYLDEEIVYDEKGNVLKLEVYAVTENKKGRKSKTKVMKVITEYFY